MNRAKEMQNEIQKFIKYRDAVFTEAVMKDNWTGVRQYFKSCGLAAPEDEIIMRVATYKAVCQCTTIPKVVKKLAMAKSEALGFPLEVQ